MSVKTIIGTAEYVWLIDQNIKKVPARIDTGARTTSIWATDIKETGFGVTFVLFAEQSPFYIGQRVVSRQFTKIIVASSTGHIQERYRIPITLQVKGRRIKTFCTLADRSTQAYPILIGRNTLRGKFIVDVQRGSRALSELDDLRFKELQATLG